MRLKALDLYVLTASFVVRLGVTFFSGLPWYATDSFMYFRQADAILQHQPISGFPNGYPLMIAAIKLAGNEEILLAFAHVFLSTAVVWLVILISRNLGYGILAGIVLAIYPNQINFCRLFLSETPTTFLLTAGVVLFVMGKYFESGLILSVACVFRSSLLPMIPGLILIGFWCKISFYKLAAFSGGCILVATIYVSLLALNIVAPSNNFSGNVLQSISFYSSSMEYDLSRASSPEQQAHPIITYLAFLKSHPLTFTIQRLDALWEMWGPWPLGETRSVLGKLLIGLRFPLLVLACRNLFKNRKSQIAWLFFTPVLCLTLVHVLLYSHSRYTVPVEPLLLILATQTDWPKNRKRVEIRAT